MMQYSRNIAGGGGAQFWEPGNGFPKLTAQDIINTNRNNGGGAFLNVIGAIAQGLYTIRNLITGFNHPISNSKGARVFTDGTYIGLTVDDLSLNAKSDRAQTLNFIEDTIDNGKGDQMRERLEEDAKFFIYNGADLFVIGKTGKIGTNQTEPNVLPLTNTVATMKIYDQTGAFVGYIPII